MKRNCLAGATGALLAALLSTSASATTTILVNNLGFILDDSVSLPSTKTPGSNEPFIYYFEFTLPISEYISASMSISGPIADQIPKNDGTLTLADWTSTGIASPFIPSGATIEYVTVSPPSKGGQDAVVGTMTPLGDFEPAGKYFVEIAGTSGGGNLQLAVDGNVTTLAVPELSTWSMLLLGLGVLGFAGSKKGRKERLAPAVA
jgi:hypothetical protein